MSGMKSTLLNNALLCVVLLLSSCSSDGFKVTETGLKYKIIEKKNGIRPVTGQMLRMHLRYIDKTGKELYNSAVLGDAFVLELTDPTFVGGLEEGFAMLGEGDSAVFMVPADSVFEKTFQQPIPARIEKGDWLRFEVRLKKVLTKGEYASQLQKDKAEKVEKDKTQLERYLAEQNISVQPSRPGVYFVVFKPGTGDTPVVGDSLEIRYTGRFLSGEVFDGSSKIGGTLKFRLQKGKYLRAWEEALCSMREGGMTRLVLSSDQAYGEQGLGPVPPDTPVIFDIELIRIF